MPDTRRLWTRFSKGELTELLEGSPDLAAYFEGCAVLENFYILRQGGIRRWPGTRFIKEVKDSSKDTILLPVVVSQDTAYILEVGDQYFRVYKDKAPVLVGSDHVEGVLPYAEADLRLIHMTQSVDVVYLFHPDYEQQKISHLSDEEWVVALQQASPPPSYEADEAFGGVLAPEANTGSTIQFRTDVDIFLAADVGRQLVYGSAKATITSRTDAREVVADISADFSQTISVGPGTISTTAAALTTSLDHGINEGDAVQLTSGPQAGQIRIVTAVSGPASGTLDTAFTANQVAQSYNIIRSIQAANWALRGSPQTTLDPNKRKPVGTSITLVAGANAFRSTDVGKYIVIYEGIIEITGFTSATTVTGVILKELTGATADDPAAATAGNWTLEVGSWNTTRGFPRTGEFAQGRLYQVSTYSQPNWMWASRSDDYDNYGRGVAADDALDYPLATRRINSVVWLAENRQAVYLGTIGAELKAIGSNNSNALIAGNALPIIERIDTVGSAPIQPVQIKKSAIFVDRTRRKLMMMALEPTTAEEEVTELSVGAEHITESGIRLGVLGQAMHPDPRVYFPREDGQLVGMTLFPEQKIRAFYRRTTQGTFEAQATIPGGGTSPDRTYVIVKRTINGQVKRYVEMFELEHEGLADRAWSSLQTDCAVVKTGIVGTTITGLDHLEGMTVQVIKNGSDQGTAVVSSGALTLQDDAVASDTFEIGLPYTSTATTMRPAVDGQVIEGLPRSWDSLFLRLHESFGGTINGEPILYEQVTLDEVTPFTGDVEVRTQEWSTDGRVTVQQTQPYPLTVLAIFGTLSLGDRD